MKDGEAAQIDILIHGSEVLEKAVTTDFIPVK